MWKKLTPTHDNIVPHGVMNQVLANIVWPAIRAIYAKIKAYPLLKHGELGTSLFKRIFW